MLFATSVLASLAVVGHVVDAASPPGTFAMQMRRDPQKHARAVQQQKRALAKRANPFPVTLGSVPYQGGGFYYVNVSVGTPPQPVQLDIDTGSSDVWMFSPQACTSQSGYGQSSSDAVECEGGFYNISASRTGKVISNGFDIQYADQSEVRGNYFSDVFGIGGQSINNLTMAYALVADGVNTGIMGIGYDTDESIVAEETEAGETPRPYKNLIDVMQSQGLIAAKSYSLYLDDLASSTGTILFGGYDPTHFQGELGILPIQLDSQSQTISSFTVIWNSVGVTANGTSTVISSKNAPNTAVLDSGTSITLLPQDIYNQLANYFGVENSEEYGAVIPCNLNGLTGSIDYQMGSPTGPVISVDFQELALPLLNTRGQPLTNRAGQDMCLFGLDVADTSEGIPILFGDTFLRSAYVIYDLDAQQIGIAQAKFGASSTNVQAISATANQTLSGSYITPSTTIAISSPTSDVYGGGFATSGGLLSALSAGSFDASSATASGPTGTAALSGYQTTYANKVTQAAQTYNGVKGGVTASASGSGKKSGASSSLAAGGLWEKVMYAAFGTMGMIALGAGLIL